MLRSITFDTYADEPSLARREITFMIYDGAQWSEPASAFVSIVPVNDNPPNINLTPLGEVMVACYLRVKCTFNKVICYLAIQRGIRKCESTEQCNHFRR